MILSFTPMNGDMCKMARKSQRKSKLQLENTLNCLTWKINLRNRFEKSDNVLFMNDSTLWLSLSWTSMARHLFSESKPPAKLRKFQFLHLLRFSKKSPMTRLTKLLTCLISHTKCQRLTKLKSNKNWQRARRIKKIKIQINRKGLNE